MNVPYSFPPCVADLKAVLRREQRITLNKESILLVNENFYGAPFEHVNRMLADSPYAARECTECRHYKNAWCKGVYSREFEAERAQLSERLEEDVYLAVKADYLNALAPFSSLCNCHCRFCYDKAASKRLMRRIPHLTFDEIRHFLHYLPQRIVYLGSAVHTVSGELLNHPDAMRVVPLLDRFCRNGIYVFSNGLALTEEHCRMLAGSHLQVALSLHMLDVPLRKYWFRYDEDFDVRKAVRNMDAFGLPYSIFLLPLRSTLASGEFLRTYQYAQRTRAQRIVIARGGAAAWHPDHVKEDLDIDEDAVRSLMGRCDTTGKTVWMADGEIGKARKTIEEYLIEIDFMLEKTGRTVILCPQLSYERFKTLERDDCRVLCVRSTEGITNPACGVTIVRDFLAALDAENGNFDTYILPIRCFDVSYYDLAMDDLDMLYDHLDPNVTLIAM